MKKWLLTIALVSCLVLLQGCLDFDNESNGGNGTRIERTTILPEGQTEEKDEEEYITGYYSTFKEAVTYSDFSENKDVKYTLGKTIKIIEDQENGVFFGTIISGGTEDFTIMSFKIKNLEGKTMYSNPLSYGPIPADFINIEKKENIVGEQKSFINLFSASPTMKKLKNYPNFKWSLSSKKEVNKLKVNNQRPTEIIPFKIGKDQLYFYYFEDLSTKDSEELKITAD